MRIATCTSMCILIFTCVNLNWYLHMFIHANLDMCIHICVWWLCILEDAHQCCQQRRFRSHVLIGRAFYTRTGSSYLCIYQCIYKYTFAHIHMYIYMHAYTFICVSWIGMYEHVHQYLHVYIYICIYIYMTTAACALWLPRTNTMIWIWTDFSIPRV